MDNTRDIDHSELVNDLWETSIKRLSMYEVYSEDSLKLMATKKRYQIPILFSIPLNIIEKYIEPGEHMSPKEFMLLNSLIVSMNASISSILNNNLKTTLNDIKELATIFFELQSWVQDVHEDLRMKDYKNIDKGKIKDQYLCAFIDVLSEMNVVTKSKQRQIEAIFNLIGTSRSSIDNYLKRSYVSNENVSRYKDEALDTMSDALNEFRKRMRNH